MGNSSETQAQYRDRYHKICNVVSDLYGEFTGDFIRVDDKTETEVRESIATAVNEKMNCNDVEKYIYVTNINGATLIKK